MRDTEVQNYIVGTNSSPRNAAEALRQGIIGSEETLLGIFDGVFYDSDNKRIGGLALNDFLIVTDQAVILWARDQQRDFVDRFPLSHAFVVSRKQKDMLHATLKLALVMPDVPNEEIDKAEPLEVTLDLIPLNDIELAAGLVDVLGCANRDMLAGGASEEDRYRAGRVLFTQVFVAKLMGNVSPSQARGKRREVAGQTYDPAFEPVAEIIEDAEAEALMTPLSRLDRLDSFETRARPAASAPVYEVRNSGSPRRSAPPNKLSASGWEEEGQSRLYGPAAAVEQELRWLNGNNPPAAGKKSERTRDTTSAPGARLREELNNSEAFYLIGRAGRTVFDNVEKLRREGEAKNAGLLPFINTMRESGMNVKDITELMVAANELLDTIGSNPAARDLAMMFVNRSLNNNGKADPPPPTNHNPRKAGRGPVQVEEVGIEPGETTSAPTRLGTRVKVERRKRETVIPELDLAELDQATAVAGGSQTHILDLDDEEVLSSLGSQTQILDLDNSASFGSQTQILDHVEGGDALLQIGSQVKISQQELNSRPPRHRVTIRRSSTSASSEVAHGGSLEDESMSSLDRAVDFAAPHGPDLN